MRLNKEIVAEYMLVNMFRRKPAADIEGKICPYCEFVNPLDAVQCSQCYYDLNKSARDQGEAVSQEVSNSIFDELIKSCKLFRGLCFSLINFPVFFLIIFL